jgi:DNA-binding transcriptional LysR family regulator
MPRIAVDVGTANSTFPMLAAGEATAATGVRHDDGDCELVAVSLGAVGVELVAPPEHPARVNASRMAQAARRQLIQAV